MDGLLRQSLPEPDKHPALIWSGQWMAGFLALANALLSLGEQRPTSSRRVHWGLWPGRERHDVVRQSASDNSFDAVPILTTVLALGGGARVSDGTFGRRE